MNQNRKVIPLHEEIEGSRADKTSQWWRGVGALLARLHNKPTATRASTRDSRNPCPPRRRARKLPKRPNWRRLAVSKSEQPPLP